MNKFNGTPYGVKVRWIDEGAELASPAPLFTSETIEKPVPSDSGGVDTVALSV